MRLGKAEGDLGEAGVLRRRPGHVPGQGRNVTRASV